MEIRILLDISEKFEKALRRIAYVIAAGAAIAKEGSAQNQDVPAGGSKRPEPRGIRRLCMYTSDDAPRADAPKADESQTADAPKTDDAPTADAPKTETADAPKTADDAPRADAPKADDTPAKKRAKAKKAAAPAVEISTPAAIAEGGMDGDGVENDVAAPADTLNDEHTEDVPEQAPETAPIQENEDELGKGAIGEIISELTGRLINRMNEEARDKATINRNLRAKCEELQLKFPTVPALIQSIGYGNAYKACIGEG